MIESLAACAPKPIQIVAVCGTNAARRAQLAVQAANLPSTVSLRLSARSREDLVKLIGASDLLVTKPGGLTPSEAFAVGTPTIVLGVISGHERENAEMFARCRLAKVSRSPASLGQDVCALIRDRPALARMRDAQTDCRRNMALNRIVDFALEKRAAVENAPNNFGRKMAPPRWTSMLFLSRSIATCRQTLSYCCLTPHGAYAAARRCREPIWPHSHPHRTGNVQRQPHRSRRQGPKDPSAYKLGGLPLRHQSAVSIAGAHEHVRHDLWARGARTRGLRESRPFDRRRCSARL